MKTMIITKEEVETIEYTIRKLNEYQARYIDNMRFSQEQQEKDSKDILKANVMICNLVGKFIAVAKWLNN